MYRVAQKSVKILIIRTSKCVVPLFITECSKLCKVIIGVLFEWVKLSEGEAYNSLPPSAEFKMNGAIPLRLLHGLDSDNFTVYKTLCFHCTICNTVIQCCKFTCTNLRWFQPFNGKLTFEALCRHVNDILYRLIVMLCLLFL